MAAAFRYAGVLPWARGDDSNIYLLLGQESDTNPWEESGDWSDFGGKVDFTDETLYDAAARECYEETHGILGSSEEIKDAITREASAYVSHDGRAVTFFMQVPYDANLPVYYARFYEFLRPHLVANGWPSKQSEPSKASDAEPCYMGEKMAIKWVLPVDIRSMTLRAKFKENWEALRNAFIEHERHHTLSH